MAQTPDFVRLDNVAVAPPRPGTGARQVLSLILLVVVAAAVPFGLRALNRLDETSRLAPSYVPAAIGPRERRPFLAEAVDRLRETNPQYVVIGDSMAGTRVNHRHLTKLIGATVAPVYEPASGSAYWYLAYKNWVVASGIRPKVVIFYFRDELLTDPMFRLNPRHLDRVAHDNEPELNEIVAAHANGPWFRVHALLRDAYQFDRTRSWTEPIIVRLPVPLAARRPSRRRLLERMNDEIFSLESLRPTTAADVSAADVEKLNFRKNLPRSVLPAILRMAKQSNTKAAFIRVQRRPVDNKPPAQSPELREYIRQLKEYLEANGAYFHDEWGDPELPLSIYRDGDHIRRDAEAHTTELLVRRNPGLFR